MGVDKICLPADLQLWNVLLKVYVLLEYFVNRNFAECFIRVYILFECFDSRSRGSWNQEK